MEKLVQLFAQNQYFTKQENANKMPKTVVSLKLLKPNLIFVLFEYFHIGTTYISFIGTQKRSFVGFKSNPSKLALCDLV